MAQEVRLDNHAGCVPANGANINVATCEHGYTCCCLECHERHRERMRDIGPITYVTAGSSEYIRQNYRASETYIIPSNSDAYIVPIGGGGDNGGVHYNYVPRTSDTITINTAPPQLGDEEDLPDEDF